MIKNVIFDIGLVLISFDWRKLMKDCGIEDNEIDRMAEATVNSKFWYELDRGILTEDEIEEGFVSIAPELKDKIHVFFSRVPDILNPFDYSDAWLESIKARGYKIYFLSNFSNRAFNKCKEKYTFLRHGDGAIISYQHKCVKPEKAIYDKLTEIYGLVPEECVFIDDNKANIEAADKFGFNTVRFLGHDDASQKLNKMLADKGIFG